MPLDPHSRARRAAQYTRSPALGQPQPGITCEGVASFLESAVEDEDFQAVRRVEVKLCIRLPSFKRNILMRIMKQRQNLDSRLAGIRYESHLVRIDAHVRAVGEIELPELDEDRAAGRRPGGMRRARRIADITPCREVSVLVLKDAVQDNELFAARVNMRREPAVGGITDDRCRPRHFAPDPVEHTTVDASYGRRRPCKAIGMNGD